MPQCLATYYYTINMIHPVHRTLYETHGAISPGCSGRTCNCCRVCRHNEHQYRELIVHSNGFGIT